MGVKHKGVLIHRTLNPLNWWCCCMLLHHKHPKDVQFTLTQGCQTCDPVLKGVQSGLQVVWVKKSIYLKMTKTKWKLCRYYNGPIFIQFLDSVQLSYSFLTVSKNQCSPLDLVEDRMRPLVQNLFDTPALRWHIGALQMLIPTLFNWTLF